MLGVTGASGEVGVMLAGWLVKLEPSQRLIVRDPGRAPYLLGAEAAQACSCGDGPSFDRCRDAVPSFGARSDGSHSTLHGE